MSDMYEYEEEEFSTQFNGDTLLRIVAQLKPYWPLAYLLSLSQRYLVADLVNDLLLEFEGICTESQIEHVLRQMLAVQETHYRQMLPDTVITISL